MSKEDSKPQTKKASSKTLDNLDSALQSLTEIVNKDATWQDNPEFVRQVNIEENDRGAAVLVSTTVENALESAIINTLKLSKNGQRELFGRGNSLLSNFSSKIIFGYRIGIFGKQTRKNLHIIRSIRNAFAHAKVPITFATPEVEIATSYLVVPKQITTKGTLPVSVSTESDADAPKAMSARHKFQLVCAYTGHNLIINTLGGRLQIEPAALGVKIPKGYEVMATKKPLP